ncbi:hypothetical protein Vadar_005611 [Vaccinium darrowii]|uniref:Uncharacterized protein n=1 Tax=Vaccinium darrowii TaxID=229202 RepID=A0ACB7XPK3_9ERIC|nr:hypothetical protein Vadar_005611 [Vaccinium darrowii]
MEGSAEKLGFAYLSTYLDVMGANFRHGTNFAEEEFIVGPISVARCDFSWGETEFHQETLNNLKVAIKRSETTSVWLEALLKLLDQVEGVLSVDESVCKGAETHLAEV